MIGHALCHVVPALHAWRCPAGGSHEVFVRVTVVGTRIIVRVIGLVA